MSFTFEIRKGVAIPKSIRPSGLNEHTFPWSDLAGSAGQEVPDSIVVPKAYWQSRGQSADKYKPTNARERIRSSFRGWQGQDEMRKDLHLVMRTTEDGVEVWVSKHARSEQDEEKKPAETEAAASGGGGGRSRKRG